MASRLIVPFDYNPPIATSVKTTAFVIPAGQYARCLVECDSGGIVTIDGVNAVTTAAFGNVDTYNAGGVNNQTSYTVPANTYAEIQVQTNNSDPTTFIISGNTAAAMTAATGTAPRISLGPGGSIAKNNNASSASYTGYTIPSNATHRQAEFWLRAGQTLSGTGNWRAIVTQYNQIS